MEVVFKNDYESNGKKEGLVLLNLETHLCEM